MERVFLKNENIVLQRTYYRPHGKTWSTTAFSETILKEDEIREMFKTIDIGEFDVAALVRLPEFKKFSEWIENGCDDDPSKMDTEVEEKFLAQLKEKLNPNLSKEQEDAFIKMLFRRRLAFPKDGSLAKCRLFEAKLEIPPGTKPVKQRQYPLQPEGESAIKSELTKLQEKDVIFQKESPWNQPVLLIKKPNGTWRTCIDYRSLNKLLRPISIPIPKISDTLNALGGNCYFSSMDMESGFFQLGLTEDAREKTCFIHDGISYQYSRLPMGCSSSPGIFQLAMQLILKGLHWTQCLIYPDDVIVFSTSFEKHLKDVNELRFEKAGVTIKPTKCE